jgi:hypothetical protein
MFLQKVFMVSSLYFTFPSHALKSFESMDPSRRQNPYEIPRYFLELFFPNKEFHFGQLIISSRFRAWRRNGGKIACERRTKNEAGGG